MITQQIIAYIQEQIKRGKEKSLIENNLRAAGWAEEDIREAFSFANPNTENAALKIAPAFAVEREEVKEVPVDKEELTKGESKPSFTPMTPVNTVTPVSYVAPVEKVETKNIDLQKFETINKPAETPIVSSNPILNAKPILQNKISANTGGASKLLKRIALVLFIVLVLGNIYIWYFVFPKVGANTNLVQSQNQNPSQSSFIKEGEVTSPNTQVSNLPADISNLANVLSGAGSAYFTKNNSYGTNSVTLSTCSTVKNSFFSDTNVQTIITAMVGSGYAMQCALGADTSGKLKQAVSFMVYAVNKDGQNYCIDSTGAVMNVPGKPMGDLCLPPVQ